MSSVGACQTAPEVWPGAAHVRSVLAACGMHFADRYHHSIVAFGVHHLSALFHFHTPYRWFSLHIGVCGAMEQKSGLSKSSKREEKKQISLGTSVAEDQHLRLVVRLIRCAQWSVLTSSEQVGQIKMILAREIDMLRD